MADRRESSSCAWVINGDPEAGAAAGVGGDPEDDIFWVPEEIPFDNEKDREKLERDSNGGGRGESRQRAGSRCKERKEEEKEDQIQGVNWVFSVSSEL